MKLDKPINENYCATVVKIHSTYPLPKCDNIIGTTVFGYPIIVGKDVMVGDVGLFFPPETQLSPEFTHNNNLYRHNELNIDKEKAGFMEDNRRIKAKRLRGNVSLGLYTGLDTLNFLGIDTNKLVIGDSFDTINNTVICRKYVIRGMKKEKLPGSKRQRRAVRKSKLIGGQFRFHQNTAQLGKNAYKVTPDEFIDVSYKLHGTSVIMSKVLCKKSINWFERFLRWCKVHIIDTEYDNVYSSRKVIKNQYMTTQEFIIPLGRQHYYTDDIWGMANERIKDLLVDGMSVYAEIVGFLPNGESIQRSYDYGCAPNTFEIYVYRITLTNVSGHVFEFSPVQVRQWCAEHGIKPVPNIFYGPAEKLFEYVDDAHSDYYDSTLEFSDNLINVIRNKHLEHDCYMCKNKVPAEGIVLRREGSWFDAYKLKSFRFLDYETKTLDKGDTNIEDDQGTDEQTNEEQLGGQVNDESKS